MAVSVDLQMEWVEFPSGDATIRGYLARPARPGPLPALVQVHEVLGITEHRQEMTRRIAEQGIVALTPDLFSRIGGKPPPGPFTTPEERRRAAFLAVPDEQAVGDLLAAHRYLVSRSDVIADRIAILGFCMGGSLALVTVCQSDAFKVFVVFYGALTKRPELCDDWQALSYLPLVRDLNCPIQIHVGTDDAIISAAEVAEFERLLREHGKDYELYTYPGAGHAFQDDPDRRYAPDHAATAQARAFEYLRERL